MGLWLAKATTDHVHTSNISNGTGDVSFVYTYYHSSSPSDSYPNRFCVLWSSGGTMANSNAHIFHQANSVVLGWTSASSTYKAVSRAYTADTSAYHTIVMSLDHGTSFNVWLDGSALSGGSQTDVGATRESNASSAAIGSQDQNLDLFDGMIAEFGVYDGVVLTAGDAAAYHATRYPPALAGLSNYYPFLSTVKDYRTGTSGTLQGSAALGVHPRATRPKRRGIGKWPTPAAPGGGGLAWKLAGARPSLAGIGGLAG